MNQLISRSSHGILYLLVFAFLLLTNSCVTQRQVEYLNDAHAEALNFPNDHYSDYVLKPNDELYIQITSLDDAASNVFTSAATQNMGNINAYGASLMSHTIDKEGYLELPVIGKVEAKGKTITQLISFLKSALLNILNQPVISIKLVNRYVSILGEVRNPGHFVYTEDKLSIFDAIGMAGDITDYGNRKQVLLIRNQDNVNIRKEINLLKSNILSSDYYFLRPGDIVYVKPMHNKFWGMRQFPFAIVLSSVTTAILVLNYIGY